MKFKFAAVLATLLAPSMALAHPGHGSHSFMSGLAHPVTGIDHLIMLFAFGLLVGAVSLANTQKLAVLISALTSLAGGLYVGQALGFSALVEPMIVASLFVISIALWQAYSPSTPRVKIALASSIALLFFHGYAHGVEAANNLTQFGFGMLLSAMGLMVSGAVMGRLFYSKWFAVAVASVSALFLLTV